jgi:phage I-like protein
MNQILTLNRALSTDKDGFIHLIPLGDFPGQIATGEKNTPIVQIINDQSLNSVMDDYTAKLQSPNWTGYLVDIEHYSHDTAQKSEAAGWIKTLNKRPDGIWGLPEWTDLGEQLIAKKRYKHLSPVLNVQKLEGNRYHVISLRDVGLTNKPQLTSLTPITNRENKTSCEHLTSDGTFINGYDGCVLHMTTCENYSEESAKRICGKIAQTTTNTNKEQSMEKMRTLLKLEPAAGEDQILAAMTQVLNKSTEADALLVRADKAEKELGELKLATLNREADAFVETHKDRLSDRAKVRDLYIANRDAAVALIALIKPPVLENTQKVLNRADGQAPQNPLGDDQIKTLNRRSEQIAYAEKIKTEKGLTSITMAWPIAQTMNPELFKD